MKTINFKNLAILIILCATSLYAKSKPNVLFIAIDDLRPELNCYGKSHIKSPNIDRLASEGLLFERAYCQQAVCGPSRASLLTGMRPDAIGNYEYNLKIRECLPNAVTLPQLFKEAGYRTISLGKIYHKDTDDKESWTDMPFFDRKKFDVKRYHLPENIKIYENALAKAKGSHKKPKGPPYECADVPDTAYRDGAMCVKVIEQMKKFKDKPFFLATGFIRPHLEFSAPKKYWDLYPLKDIELTKNSKYPKNAPKIAGTNWDELKSYHGMQGTLSKEKAKTLIRGYYACVSYIDAQVGKLLDTLDELDLRKNTIVILWGDHGWKLGDHSMWCKHTNFEIDTRVPLIISAPGMKAGQRTKALTELVDVYPSLAELCGLKAPSTCEGKSFVPLLKNPKMSWKKAAYSQYPRAGDKKMGYSVKTDKFRYTEWVNRTTKKVESRELYDHSKNVLDNVNIAGDRKYKKVVSEHHKLVRSHFASLK